MSGRYEDWWTCPRCGQKQGIIRYGKSANHSVRSTCWQCGKESKVMAGKPKKMAKKHEDGNDKQVVVCKGVSAAVAERADAEYQEWLDSEPRDVEGQEELCE